MRADSPGGQEPKEIVEIGPVADHHLRSEAVQGVHYPVDRLQNGEQETLGPDRDEGVWPVELPDGLGRGPSIKDVELPVAERFSAESSHNRTLSLAVGDVGEERVGIMEHRQGGPRGAAREEHDGPPTPSRRGDEASRVPPDHLPVDEGQTREVFGGPDLAGIDSLAPEEVAVVGDAVGRIAHDVPETPVAARAQPVLREIRNAALSGEI